LSLSCVAFAGTGVWTSGGPYGGVVPALAIDPSTPSTLYAGTDEGVYKSTDSGDTWAPANVGLSNEHVSSLAIDPRNPSTLYAAVYSGGVFRSTDSGGTWANVGAGLTGQNVLHLAIDPRTPSTLYAGTLEGRVFRSSDAGGAWTEVSAGLPGLGINALAIDPATPATLYVATWGGGIFKSACSGDAWAAVNSGLPSLNALVVTIDPATPSTLYAATEPGVFKSTDAGGSWTAASNGLSGRIVDLAVDPSDPATLYAASWSRPALAGRVFKSTDSGGTWTPSDQGLRNANVIALAIDPRTPSTLYAGTNGPGVFRSTDAGRTWAASNAGLSTLLVTTIAVDPATPTTVYAGAYFGGVSKSRDSGRSWTVASVDPADPSMQAIQVLDVDPSTPSTLYAGTEDGGVFKSRDGGASWTAANTGLTDWDVHLLVIDPTTPSTLYAGTGAGGIFKSTDSAATWKDASAGLGNLRYPRLSVSALAIDAANPSTLYAGTQGGGVFKSTDAAGSWTAANTHIQGHSISDVVIDPTDPSTLYASYNRWLYRSTDAGGTWFVISSLGEGGLFGSLANHPSAPTVLWSGSSFGVLRSTDSGRHFAWVSSELGEVPVSALSLDPAGATTVYASFRERGGVWRATPSGWADADLALDLSDSPDPVTGTTPLTYTLGVVNAGPAVAHDVSVSHTLPSGSSFDSASGSGWTCSHTGGVVTCTCPGLAAGPAPEITVRVAPGPAASVLVSSAAVSATEHDPDEADNTDSETTTVRTPLVWMGTRTKTVVADAPAGFAINGAVTYTIVFANAGTGSQADNPGHELVDTLPWSLSLVSADATSGTVAVDLPANAVTWDGSVPAGASVSLAIHATVQPRVALGTTVANQATVSYDADGNGTNDAFVLTDDPDEPGPGDPTRFVVISPPTSFYTLQPCRLLDTRLPDGTHGGPALEANADRVFLLGSRCGIPSTARAVSVNLTVTQPSAQGHLRLYPAGTPLPLVSSVNYVAGQTRANNAVVLLNGLGEIAVRCTQDSGIAHLVLDVNGYFE
jgi:uncharacterized repeat protein (TIGR01451 family)